MNREAFCSHCDDAGMLSILSGESIAQFKVGEMKIARTLAVACSCRRGDKYVTTCKGWRFNAERMFPWAGDVEGSRERLVDFIERKRLATVAAAEWNPDNFAYPGADD